MVSRKKVEEVSEELSEETVVKKDVTILSKSGVVYELTDPIMISAFRNQGFTEEIS